MTGVWHESVLRAGFMIAPGPLLAGLTAFPGGVLGGRLGHRVVGTAGALFFAAGGLWWVATVGATPGLAGRLPAGQPARRFRRRAHVAVPRRRRHGAAATATLRHGSALYAMTRQIGVALGVACLVAILGTATGPRRSMHSTTPGSSWPPAASSPARSSRASATRPARRPTPRRRPWRNWRRLRQSPRWRRRPRSSVSRRGGPSADDLSRKDVGRVQAVARSEWVQVTCCFTDIQGSTQLLRDLGPVRYQRVVNEHFSVLREALGCRGGTELGTSGDGMFMSFPDPHRAIDACLDAQRSFTRLDIGDGRVLRVRMGVHSGPAVVDPVEGYVGLTVHEAARIMTAAHGGQVLLSADTVSLVPSVSTWSLGAFLLKDIEGPVELHQLRHDDLQTNFPPVHAPRDGGRSPTSLPPTSSWDERSSCGRCRRRGTKPGQGSWARFSSVGRLASARPAWWGGWRPASTPRERPSSTDAVARASPSRISPSAKRSLAGRRTPRTRNWLRWWNAGARISPGFSRSSPVASASRELLPRPKPPRYVSISCRP